MLKNKKGLKISLVFLAGAFTWGGFYIHTLLKIGLGYKAKMSCSAAFVSNTKLEVLDRDEFTTNPILPFISVTIDGDTKEVKTDLFSIISRKAIYRPNIGCTLDNGIALKSVPAVEEIKKIVDQTIDYQIPQAKNIPPIVKSNLENVVNSLFQEDSTTGKKNTRAVLVLKNGKILAEQYSKDFSANSPMLGWSMTKSVTHTLVGLQIKEQKLALEQKYLLPNWTDNRSEISLDNLLKMNSGLAFNESYGSVSDATRMLFLSQDMANFAISQKLEKSIGEVWSYSSGTTNIVSQILKNSFSSPNDYYLFPYRALFSKLGMKSPVLEVDGEGTFVGSSFMYATARDWSKLGLLYLQDGIWQGERILPENWVKYTVTSNPQSEKGRYGAHFWLNAGNKDGKYWESLPSDLYYMSGYDGQYVIMIPSKNLVIVRMGQTRDKNILKMEQFIKNIIDITEVL